jgi:selenium metabolism protein YedF
MSNRISRSEKMDIKVDARGKPCPQPVVMTKKSLDSIQNGRVVVLVDNEIARENVVKLAKSLGLVCEAKQKGQDYEIAIVKSSQEQLKDTDDAQILCDAKPKGEYVVLVSGDTFGEGSEELGRLLLKSYIYTLTDATILPSAIIFVNRGVFVTTNGSDSIDALKKLEASGVEVLSCGTCLDYYDLKDKLAVGKVTNMYEIAERTSLSNTVSI